MFLFLFLKPVQFQLFVALDKVCRMTPCNRPHGTCPQVERNLLSPYVSPRDSPFRHIFIGSGQHTFKAIVDQLEAFRLQNSVVDVDTFKTELALATWTLQGCANSLAGDVWSLDNEI